MLKTKWPPGTSARNTVPIEPAKVLHVMKRERAIGEIERRLRQFEAFQIRAEIAHARIGRLRPRPRQHVFGQIDAAARRPRPGSSPIGRSSQNRSRDRHALSAQIGQKRAQRLAIPDRRPIRAPIGPSGCSRRRIPACRRCSGPNFYSARGLRIPGFPFWLPGDANGAPN